MVRGGGEGEMGRKEGKEKRKKGTRKLWFGQNFEELGVEADGG